MRQELGAIAVGAYTLIKEIVAPSQAAAGAVVSVVARIVNTYSAAIYIAASAQVDGLHLTPIPDYAEVKVGLSQNFTFSFTMGGASVTFHVWSYYWTGTEWYVDDYRSAVIALAALPEYRGSLSRKELEYDGNRSAIPAL